MRVGILLGFIVIVGMSGCESRAQARRKQLVNDARQLSLAYQSYSARPVGVARKPPRATAEVGSDQSEPNGPEASRESME